MKPAIPLEEILEKDWQRTVRDMAEMLGYRRAYHTYDSRRSDTGFPDLVLVSPQRKRIVYLELKRENGKVSDSQKDWIQALHKAGAEVYVVRPRHLDALAKVLSTPTTDTITTHYQARRELLLELDRHLERGAT